MSILDCFSHKGSRTMSMDNGSEKFENIKIERINRSLVYKMNSERKIKVNIAKFV